MDIDRPTPQPAHDVVELWSFREDTLVELPDDDEGEALITTRWGELRFSRPRAVLRTALERMSYGPVSLRNVVPGFGSAATAARDGSVLSEALEGMQHVVVRSLATADGRPLLSAVPISRSARFRPVRPRPGTAHRLSRFAQLRVAGDGLRIESPLSAHRVELHRTEASLLVSCFGHPSTVEAAAERLRLPAGMVRMAVGYLTAAGMVVSSEPRTAEQDEHFAEDRDPTLVTWSPHDLMLHSRSRLGRHDDPFGATYPDLEEVDSEPALKPPAGGVRIPLPRPDLDRLLREDPPVTAVLEARRSIRHYGDHPLNLRQIGELLYRSARVRSLVAPVPGDPASIRGSNRPYPSTGATYALELYVTVGCCDGLTRGIYHYDPLEHALRTVDAPKGCVDELLDEARMSAGLGGEPPVLITMTARFRRMTRKYGGLAYSGLLKDVGVLQQTLYLVCTAMGMAPCALAVGDSDLSARALGLDWRLESSIGEFVLGSPRPDALRPEESGFPANGHGWRRRCAEVVHRMASRPVDRPAGKEVDWPTSSQPGD